MSTSGMGIRFARADGLDGIDALRRVECILERDLEATVRLAD
jgi:hypothetical protein